MKTIPSIRSFVEQLNPIYFWDVDWSRLDPQTGRRLIIERIFTRGQLHEMKLAVSYYGKYQVLTTLKDLPYLDPKTLNFVAKLFHKPLKEFRCYQRKQSGPQRWNS